MPCHNFQEKMYDFLEGSLSVEEASEIKDHLQTCDLCSEELRKKETFLKIEKSLPEFDPPPFMTKRIMANIREDIERPQGFLGWLKSISQWKLATGSATMCAFLAVTIFTYNLYMPDTTEHSYSDLSSLSQQLVISRLHFNTSTPIFRSGNNVKNTTGKIETSKTLTGYDAYSLGRTEIEAAALISVHSYELAQQNFEQLSTLIKKLQLPEESFGSFNEIQLGLGTSSQKPEEILFELSEIKAEIEVQLDTLSNTIPPLYELGSLLVKISLFASAKEKEYLQQQIVRLDELINNFETVGYSENFLTPIKDIKNIATMVSPTKKDLQDLMENIQTIETLLQAE